VLAAELALLFVLLEQSARHNLLAKCKKGVWEKAETPFFILSFQLE
jgi:hypothetical protein